jgi:hypothetical protein
MNERIRKLAVQAGATLEKGYIELSDGQFMLSDNVDLDTSNMDLEKFAELIVEEVYDYILNATFDDEPWPSRKDVKQHFGVEE